MRIFAAVLSTVALVACGSTGGAHGAPSPSASALPAGATVANADQGKTFELKVGEEVEVALRQEPGFMPWQDVHSSDTMVLQPAVDTKAASVVGMSLHRFKATAPGQAQVLATTAVACSPGAACPALARAWQVTIVVS